MKKLLSKLALLLTSSAMAIGVGIVAFAGDLNKVRADDYTSTLAPTEAPTNGGTIEATDTDPAQAVYTWTTDDGTYIGYDNPGVHSGSGTKYCSFQQFVSNSFNDALISKVTVRAKSNGTNRVIAVSIGGNQLGEPQLFTNSFANYEFSNTTTNYVGQLVVDLTKDNAQSNIVTASIIVEYSMTDPKSITSLSAVLNDPNQEYFATESVATSDIKLTVNYDDDSHDVVTNGTGLTITSGNPLVAGENTISISFTNIFGTETTSFVVNARPEKVLDHYAIVGDLTKKEYYDGDDWDLSGLVLKAYYKSGEDDLDPIEIGSLADLKAAGDLDFTLSPSTALYGTRKLNIGAVQYLTVDVEGVKISGIQVQEQEKFVKYTASSLEDGNYCLVYDGKAMNNVDVTPTGNTNRRLGAVDATISANKLIAPAANIIFKITKVDDVNNYYTIQDADDKYVVHNGSGSSNYIAMKAIDGEPTNIAKWTIAFDNENKTYDFVNVGYNTYMIRYNTSYFASNKGTTGGKLTLYKEPVPLVSIQAEKTDLGFGDEITITATPINGATGTAAITVDDDSLINFVDNHNNTATVSVKNDILTSGEVVVTATLNESSASILLNISNAVELSSIAIKTNPKLNYVTGETIDLSGLEVEATFSNSHVEDVTNDVEISDTSGIDVTVKGSHEVTVSYTYNELTRYATFTLVFAYPVITVTEAIAIIKPLEKQTPTEQTYRITGVIVDKEWSNGSANINIAEVYNEQDPDKLFQIYHAFVDNKTSYDELLVGAHITFESKLQKFVKSGQDIYETTANPEIVSYDTEVAKLVTGISVHRNPDKTQYYVGDSNFDYSGLQMYVHYNTGSGDRETVKYSDDEQAFLDIFAITNPDTSDSKANALVTITHKATGFTATFTVSVSDVKVSSIKVTTNPDKTAYASGETFDPTGIVVTAVYNNGHEEDVTNPELLTYSTPSGDGKLHDGDNKVKVTYDNNNNIYTYIDVTVADRYVTGISAEFSSHGLNKDVYDIGATFNTDSLLIYIEYSDGDKVKYNSKNADYTTLFTITPPDMNSYGDKDVAIALKNTIHTTSIKIHIRGIEELSIDQEPYRLIYRVGDELDFNGIVLTALYSDTTTQDVKMNWEGVTVTGDTSVDGAQQAITISYKGQSDSFNIDVWMTDDGMAALIESEIAKLRALYSEEEYNDANWAKVQKIIDDTEDVLELFDPRNEGEHYSSDVMDWINAAKAEINAIPVRALDHISISGPTKTTYLVGEELDTTGLVVKAHYSDSSSKTLSSDKYSLSEVDMSTAGTKTVTVTYGGKSETFNITVNEPVVVSSIEVKTQPTKTTYEIGDSFNPAGLVVTVKYSDNTSEDITSGFELSGFSSEEAGTKTITVTYEGKTTTFSVTVNEPVPPTPEKTLESITISGPTKTTYELGEDLDTTGLVVTAHYDNNTTATVTNVTVTGYNKNQSGEQTITVSYTEGDVTKTATFTVTVAEPTPIYEKTLENITIAGPTKTTYEYGEELNTAGLVVTAHYSDNTTATVTNVTVTGYNRNQSGQQTITVSYTEGGVTKTATFTVTVGEEPVDPAVVEEARTEAIAELNDFFDSIDLTGYSAEVIAQFNAAKQQAMQALGGAATEEEIATALANAKAALNALINDNPKPTPTPEPATTTAGASAGLMVLMLFALLAVVIVPIIIASGKEK